jgi:predicted DCC family thiol-disulfide oxidoreductase YuxK
MVVETGDAAFLERSDACIHVLRRLGGGSRIAAAVVAAIPRPLRDALYDLIARTRYRFIGRRDDLCPVVLPELRDRFDP